MNFMECKLDTIFPSTFCSWRWRQQNCLTPFSMTYMSPLINQWNSLSSLITSKSGDMRLRNYLLQGIQGERQNNEGEDMGASKWSQGSHWMCTLQVKLLPILSLGFHSYIPSPTYWNELFGSTLTSNRLGPLVGIDYLGWFGPWEGAKYCGSRLRT
jgi:hypothetical protein